MSKMFDIARRYSQDVRQTSGGLEEAGERLDGIIIERVIVELEADRIICNKISVELTIKGRRWMNRHAI